MRETSSAVLLHCFGASGILNWNAPVLISARPTISWLFGDRSVFQVTCPDGYDRAMSFIRMEEGESFKKCFGCQWRPPEAPRRRRLRALFD